MHKETRARDISRDAPIRLALAARLAFPDGSMTVSGLRREAQRGRLVVERIAGKDFTTLENIDRMRELCRVPPREFVYGYDRAEPAKESDSDLLRGSSSIEAGISPQDALRMKLQKQKHVLLRTSPANTNHNENGST